MTQLDLQIEQRLRGRRGTNAADVLREIGAHGVSVYRCRRHGTSFYRIRNPAFGLLFCLALAWRFALRERHGRIALQYVEQAVRQNLPLPAMLHAAASGESGGLRRQLLRLAGYIESGATLGEAMERSLPGIPRRNVALIDAAEQLGILPVVLCASFAGRKAKCKRTRSSPSTFAGIQLCWSSRSRRFGGFSLSLSHRNCRIFSGTFEFNCRWFHDWHGEISAVTRCPSLSLTRASPLWWRLTRSASFSVHLAVGRCFSNGLPIASRGFYPSAEVLCKIAIWRKFAGDGIRRWKSVNRPMRHC